MGYEARAGRAEKGDALVCVRRSTVGRAGFNISSPVRNMFREQQDAAVERALDECGIDGVIIEIEDNQALDFVITARVKAAVQRLDRGNDE